MTDDEYKERRNREWIAFLLHWYIWPGTSM
jgi:hypothetical protein